MSRTPAWATAARATSGDPSSTNAGALAAAAWQRDLGAVGPTHSRWHVEIALALGSERPSTDYDEATATRFHIDIYAEEWGVFFCHRAQQSWIRITDIAFVHGRDDFQLLGVVPPLRDIGRLVRQLERRYAIAFSRQHASVRTNLVGAEPAIRSWIARL